MLMTSGEVDCAPPRHLSDSSCAPPRTRSARSCCATAVCKCSWTGCFELGMVQSQQRPVAGKFKLECTVSCVKSTRWYQSIARCGFGTCSLGNAAAAAVLTTAKAGKPARGAQTKISKAGHSRPAEVAMLTAEDGKEWVLATTRLRRGQVVPVQPEKVCDDCHGVDLTRRSAQGDPVRAFVDIVVDWEGVVRCRHRRTSLS